MAITISSPNITVSNPSDFANRLQTYFTPQLQKALEDNLVMGRYGWQGRYPALGSTIRFFRPRPANRTGVQAVSEGVVPTTLTEVATSYVDVSLSQRGALAKITDIVQATDLINTLQLYTKTMAADAALDFDSIVRNAVVAGLKARSAAPAAAGTYYGSAGGGYFERFGAVSPTTTNLATAAGTDFATLAAAAASGHKMTRALNLAAATQLKTARVPQIGGKYVAIIAPEVMHDIRQDTTWVQAATQVDTNSLYNRASIVLDGVAFVETSNAFREDVYGTYLETGKVFSNIYLGDGAFGVPQLSNNKAGSSPMAPSLISITKPDHSNPLAQWVTVGWKAFYGAALLTDASTSWDVPHCLNLRTRTTFS